MYYTYDDDVNNNKPDSANNSCFVQYVGEQGGTTGQHADLSDKLNKPGSIHFY